MTNDNSSLLTVSEALAVLGISRATFDRWKKDKQLPYIKIGKEVFVNKDKLYLWMKTFDTSAIKNKAEQRRTIHIGYQSGSAQLWSSIIIKHLQLLESQLSLAVPDQELTVQWHHANNGIELVQQFISDQLSIIAVGDFPIHISFNLARLFPNFNPLLIAFDGKSINNEGIALVTQHNLSLDQKKLDIATVTSTSSAFHLQQHMKKNNINYNPVAKQTMDQCMNSFLQQEVDAAMLWEPYISIVEQLSAGKRLQESDSTPYLTGILANQNHLQHKNQHAITVAYLKALIIAHKLLFEHDDMAIQAIEQETGLATDIIKTAITHIRFDAAVYYEDIKRINNIFSDSNFAQAIIDTDMMGLPRPKIHYDDTFLCQAVKELNIPEIPKKSLSGEWVAQRY